MRDFDNEVRATFIKNITPENSKKETISSAVILIKRT